MPRPPDTVRDAPGHDATSRQMPLPFPTVEQLAAASAVDRAITAAKRRHPSDGELARVGDRLVEVLEQRSAR